MLVIVINGTINSGKSTVGQGLAGRLPHTRFIEGDDHGVASSAPFEQMLDLAIGRLARRIRDTREHLVIAYPLRMQDYERRASASVAAGHRLMVVTLAPPLQVALGQRGDRVLGEDERRRIVHMYEEGYHNRPFTDVMVTGDPPISDVIERLAGEVARVLSSTGKRQPGNADLSR